MFGLSLKTCACVSNLKYLANHALTLAPRQVYTITLSCIHLYVQYAFWVLISIINYVLSIINYANVEASILDNLTSNGIVR